MWLSDYNASCARRACRRIGGLLLAMAMLTGCGFQPLYGTGANKNVPAQLQQTRIELIPDRLGQQLRNLLLDRFNPTGQPARPVYSLVVTPTLSRTNLGIERDETATRALLQLNAKYALHDARSGKLLFSGSERSVNSFNIVDSDFATQSAEEDALFRASREISDAIRNRLGIYFSAGA